jgi:hypothetical protein
MRKKTIEMAFFSLREGQRCERVNGKSRRGPSPEYARLF